MRVAFAGTPELAATILQAMISHGYRPTLVLTQPDRPAGRGRKPRASAVKVLATAEDLEVCQPPTLRDGRVQRALAGADLDLMVVAAYGLILPAEVLGTPRLGCVNVHASLLPRWRGAAPIQRAILAGDRESGVTLMRMDEGLDTGPVLAVHRCPVTARDTGGSLHDRIAELGARALVEAMPAIEAGTLHETPQDEDGVTYAQRISKDEARIDWSESAGRIERQVRAFDPWPVAFTEVGDGSGRRLRIWAARVLPDPAAPGTAGTVLPSGRGRLVVGTADRPLELLEVQAAGGRRIAAADYLNAHPLPPGTRLGAADGSA